LCKPPEHWQRPRYETRMVSGRPWLSRTITAEGYVTKGGRLLFVMELRRERAVRPQSPLNANVCVHIKNRDEPFKHINLQDEGVLAGLTDAARSIKRHGALANVEISTGESMQGSTWQRTWVGEPTSDMAPARKCFQTAQRSRKCLRAHSPKSWRLSEKVPALVNDAPALTCVCPWRPRLADSAVLFTRVKQENGRIWLRHR